MESADARVAPARSAWPHRTARSGTRGCSPTCSAGSIRETGAIKEYPLKTPQSGPHGLTFDKDGNIWFTANSKGYIGKLDPETGEITEYKMPEGARDPHTPLFDSRGRALVHASRVATWRDASIRKPATSRSSPTPTPRSLPYGMVFTSKGVPIICEFGSNKIAQNRSCRPWRSRSGSLPNADSRPRRIAITSDDAMWYADYSRGYLGRLDPETGEVKEWPSPGGPKSQPYGITALNDVIWYSESAVRPNTLVRFDPRTEKFQTWIIPAGGGVVRNMMTTRDGNLVIAESGVNKVGLVEIGK